MCAAVFRRNAVLLMLEVCASVDPVSSWDITGCLYGMMVSPAFSDSTGRNAICGFCLMPFPSGNPKMLMILVLTGAMPSPHLRTSVWRLLSVSTHLAGPQVEPILHGPQYQHYTVLLVCPNQCFWHPSTIHLPACHPLHSTLHTKPWGRDL